MERKESFLKYVLFLKKKQSNTRAHIINKKHCYATRYIKWILLKRYQLYAQTEQTELLAQEKLIS